MSSQWFQEKLKSEMMKKNKELEEMRHQAIVDKEWHHKTIPFYFVFINISGFFYWGSFQYTLEAVDLVPGKIQNNDLTTVTAGRRASDKAATHSKWILSYLWFMFVLATVILKKA